MQKQNENKISFSEKIGYAVVKLQHLYLLFALLLGAVGLTFWGLGWFTEARKLQIIGKPLLVPALFVVGWVILILIISGIVNIGGGLQKFLKWYLSKRIKE